MLILMIYRLLYTPLLFIVSLLRWLNPKVSRGFTLRKSVNNTPPWLDTTPDLKPIWIHCSSGEFEYAKPIIRELKKQYPNEKVLVTYFSPSVVNSIKSFLGVDFYCPTPWDQQDLWNQFIEHHKPKALLIARTDLWPIMISACEQNNIPRLLFSKTVNEKKEGWAHSLSGLLMKKMTDIFCVSELDRELLYKKIKPYQNIHSSGDTRYDQCLFRIQNPQTLKPLNNFNKPIFVAGSTWPKDEETLLSVIKNKRREISFILAPHEPSPTHLDTLKKEFKKQDIKYQLYSQINSWDPEAVLLIDQVGILADLYAWGQMSFIGGSMDRSVHSVLEALAQGNLTFVGPHHYNNREALLFKSLSIKNKAPVQSISTSQELEILIEQNLETWTQTHRFELQHLVKSRQGASLRVLKWIEKNTTLGSL